MRTKKAIRKAEAEAQIPSDFPRVQRAIAYYCHEPGKNREYLLTLELVDSFLAEIGIVIPDWAKGNSEKAIKYFELAEERLAGNTEFEKWAK